MLQRATSSLSSTATSSVIDSGVAEAASLRRKGTLVLGALVLYLVLATLIIAWERQQLFFAVNALEGVHAHEEQQLSLNLSVSHSVLAVNERYFSPDLRSSAKVLKVDLDSVIAGLHRMLTTFPDLQKHIDVLEVISAELVTDPTQGTVVNLRAAYHELVLRLDATTNEIRDKKQQILAGYRDAYNRAMIEWLLLVVLGVGAFGGVGSFFFDRLSRDIMTVRARAREIIRGYRGEPLEVVRKDEIGVLMAAVNDMQGELRTREIQLELSRQQRFHTEKMAAVGSLAAAVAHEINNPLAAIVGIAEHIETESVMHHCSAHDHPCQARLILEQARRVMSITRQIGEFSIQRPIEPELVDLNAVIRSTCSFVSFDKRFRGVTVEQDLDLNLPAVFVVSDQIVQVLMNVLINSADALEGRRGNDPKITVATRIKDGVVVLEVGDNGHGIDGNCLFKVFDEHFTTKAPGRGSGLGLSLCRSLIQQAGGDIQLESTLDVGTKVRIMLPEPAPETASL